MAESHYILPSHPSVLCEDRFSILDSEDLHVPFWELLTTLLNTPKVDSATALIDILETISVVRRGRADSDYGSLKQFLSSLEKRGQFFQQTWPALKNLALEMPALFPNSQIPILGREQTTLVFSRRQIACLVVHQFLCTLTAPTWQDGFQDFHIWYSSDQPHARVVEAYLTALFEYFSGLIDKNEYSPLKYVREDWAVTYTLHTFDNHTISHTTDVSLRNLTVLKLPNATTHPSILGLPAGAAVISANKYIGFGPTGTQEEKNVGSSPEACPAVLITPPLEDGQVLVVTGPEAIIAIEGYGREAHCGQILRPDKEEQSHRWKQRTMLFMDAMELDLVDREAGLPDLQPGNVDREFRKAYTAFQSYRQSARLAYSPVYTGYWGCGTFGGNVGVKSLIQWCAARFAGCDLVFVCFGEEHGAFGGELERFVNEVEGNSSATEIMEVLRRLKPEDVAPGDPILEIVKAKIPK